ncbi:nitronate monooxygenase [Anoxybacteroides tepidamans]|uniref:nitronate monooxygenase n=1 Tax=Anoxybacteroides tepidamans TaxID=265948 RepID=UPI000557B54B|nr:nitronate monooxygenase [Anoxybacillus tepidamans]
MQKTILHTLRIPIIQAPMAGGVSTPRLAATVSNAGGLGFLAGGYKTAEEMRKEIIAVREMTSAPFGVNVFVPGAQSSDEKALSSYQKELRKEAERLGVPLGDCQWDDDDWEAKLVVLYNEKIPVVSFTFGCPSADIIARLKANGSFVIVTVTSTEEAIIAAQAGAEALCVQGEEAGAHRAVFRNAKDADQHIGLFTLLQQIRTIVDLPLIGAGGIMTGRDLAAVLAAGACAAQLGTAFLRCSESGAHPVHKAALVDPQFSETVVTRAFTGRPARGLVNRFLAKYDAMAPAAYPQVHHMTKSLRKAAAEQNDPHTMALWAGRGYRLAKEMPAAELLSLLMEEAREAVREAMGRVDKL